MLVYTSFALCFVYTSWRFYAFSRTNILTRCHSASSCLLLFLCFRKVTQEIFSELGETKAEVPNYLTRRRSPKENRRRTKGQPHQGPATRWCNHLVHLLTSPFCLFIPFIEKTLGPKHISRKHTASRRRRRREIGGSRSSSQHPAGEGNHHRRPSSSPCLPSE
jgi:hypothetical protein